MDEVLSDSRRHQRLSHGDGNRRGTYDANAALDFEVWTKGSLGQGQ